jgi:hypothetical protein
VLIPLLVVFTGGLVFFGVGLFRVVTEPIDATNQYLSDVRAGRYAAAYAHTCTYANDVPNLQEFIAQQQTLDRRYGKLTEYDITGFHSTGSGITTDGTWVRGGRERDVAFRLRNERDGWKVCSTDPNG